MNCTTCSTVTVELLDQRYVLVPAKVHAHMCMVFITFNFL